MSEPRRWWIEDNEANREVPADVAKPRYVEVIASNGKEVNRFKIRHFDEIDGLHFESESVVSASDHDRIVAEKDEEIARLKESLEWETALKRAFLDRHEEQTLEIARLNRLCQIMFDPENQPPQYTTEEAFKLWKDGAL